MSALLSPTLVGLLVAAAVVAGAASRQPRARLTLPGGPAPRPARDPRRAWEAAPRWQRWAVVVAAVLAGTVTVGPLALVVPPLVIAARAARARAERRATDRATADDLVAVTELLVIAARAGLTAPAATAAAARHGTGPVAAALRRSMRREGLGDHPDDALSGVIAEVGEPARPLIELLIGARRDGGPVLAPLDEVARELRTAHLRRAEAEARRVPVRLLFPLACCTLPAFVLLTVVPVLISALGSLPT